MKKPTEEHSHGCQHEELLFSILEKGKLVYKLPSLTSIRERAQQQLSFLPKDIKILHPGSHYPTLCSLGS